MRRQALWLLVLIAASHASAEVRDLTMRDAVALALKQNPDVVLARYDERKADEAVRIARDPFIPKVVVGSGLAYSNGMPMSIEGSTPSIFQAQGIGSVFNRPQSYRIAAARENRRTAALDTAAKQEEAVWRAAELYIDAERVVKQLDAVRRESDGLERALEAVRARIVEGRELPIEGKKAELMLARARYRRQALEGSVRTAEDALAAVLGLEPGERVRVVTDQRPLPELPPSADAAVQTAFQNSKQIRALESRMLAKGHEVRSAKASWLPQADLVAQYALLGRYNNYDQFFNRFQRHNGQLGVSFQVPVWAGTGARAQGAQSEAEAAQIRVQLRNTRRKLEDDTRRALADVEQAETAQQVARLDLEVAREQVSVLLAQSEEGRAPIRELEEARFAETGKWIDYYDAAAALEKARLAVLRETGTLSAALQ
ncbi:MAG TPA: TolC family protein [Bryobacteraceae bacterium]|nr:TolC family protein [Bryobacteraceae bacterium]